MGGTHLKLLIDIRHHCIPRSGGRYWLLGHRLGGVGGLGALLAGMCLAGSLLRVFLELRPLREGVGALLRDLAVGYLVYLGLERS